MTAPIALGDKPAVVYPESDGKPMADNTLQFRIIVMIEGGIDTLFLHDPQVFVAGDLLWYPVEGHPEICAAPDTMAVFGRPKGDRGSYRQWEEDNIAPQVAFEVLSPNNRPPEMLEKFRFYERYGVDEYYVHDPDRGTLAGWLREGGALRPIPVMTGWVSPRLQVRFELVEGELQLYGPDGKRFATYVELAQQVDQAQRDKELAQRDKELAQQQTERLAAQLRALGVEPHK
jgi:Uma2 family endonuclease